MKKNSSSNINLNLNINKDDSNLNDFLYCWEKFGSRPNKFLIHSTYSSKDFNDVLSNYVLDKNCFTEVIPAENDFIINDKMFVTIEDQSIYCSFIVIDRKSDSSLISDLVFFYKESNDIKKVEDIIRELETCQIDFCESETNKLNTISLSSHTELELEPLEIKYDEDNIELYYNKKTLKSVDKLIKEIKKSSKGLAVLVGDRGTGKSSIINYIADNLDRIVIYIPNNMIDHTINNPDFRKFLKRYYRPILIIDDCEVFLDNFYSKSNLFLSNILQLTDGFLSDTTEATIVTIFNDCDERDIESDFIESNNLIRVVKFEELTEEESLELSEHLGLSKKNKNKLKLVDIIKNRKSNTTHDIGL